MLDHLTVNTSNAVLPGTERPSLKRIQIPTEAKPLYL
jgi:hypothetical protein